MDRTHLEALVLQSLEHERGGVRVYTTALKCVENGDLEKEWKRYLGETEQHVARLEAVCKTLSIDANRETLGRLVVRHVGAALVEAMELAMAQGAAGEAQLVACECVVFAETKDHLTWELLGKCAPHLEGDEAEVLQSACGTVEEQEGEHLYHATGWCRELWLQSLGLRPVLPPPEEAKHVKKAIATARAEKSVSKAR